MNSVPCLLNLPHCNPTPGAKVPRHVSHNHGVKTSLYQPHPWSQDHINSLSVNVTSPCQLHFRCQGHLCISTPPLVSSSHLHVNFASDVKANASCSLIMLFKLYLLPKHTPTEVYCSVQVLQTITWTINLSALEKYEMSSLMYVCFMLMKFSPDHGLWTMPVLMRMFLQSRMPFQSP